MGSSRQQPHLPRASPATLVGCASQAEGHCVSHRQLRRRFPPSHLLSASTANCPGSDMVRTCWSKSSRATISQWSVGLGRAGQGPPASVEATRNLLWRSGGCNPGNTGSGASLSGTIEFLYLHNQFHSCSTKTRVGRQLAAAIFSRSWAAEGGLYAAGRCVNACHLKDLP